VNETDLTWMLIRALRVTRREDGYTYEVEDLAGLRSCVLTIDADGELRFNGRRVDVGDDYPCFLALIDAADESETGTAIIADGPEEPSESWLARPSNAN
jgi:hypothetical protein